MFNQILKLIRQNSDSTPLEDYTTELFVGALNNDDQLKESFCKDFLKLESASVKITTQEYYSLEDDKNCIVDVVIKGQNEICFIENKVNSKEGVLQLDRYSRILDRFDNIKTKLVYCTKNSDPKSIKNHSFMQCKWHDVSEFFKKNSKEKITTLFIDFLKQNNMSTDMTIKGIHISALENATSTFRLIDRNIDNVVDEFSNKFGKVKDLRHKSSFRAQINDHERICVMATPLDNSKSWSEVLYGFEFKGNLISQIYLDKANEFHDEFVRAIKKQNILKYEIFDFGSVIYIDKNLGDFLNDEESESKIREWFLQSFELLEDFMANTNDIIDWQKLE